MLQDRIRIRTRQGLANTTLFRRFAIGHMEQRGEEVAETMPAGWQAMNPCTGTPIRLVRKTWRTP
ncbi:MAG: hypothetical protein OXF88_06220 [Rhodobacteraceae bacterium]|nr:hypothetical protein [Paracoccaceae bacterium]